MVPAWQMKTASIRNFSFSYIILDHVLPVRNYWIIIIICACNNVITYFIIGKKKYDTNNHYTTLFSDLYTVSNEAFGKFTIERCWDIWLKECKEEFNKNDFLENNNEN